MSSGVFDSPPGEGQPGGDGTEPEQNHAEFPISRQALSPDTLVLFAEILEDMRLPVGHPEFEQRAPRFIVAKRELAQALQDAADATGLVSDHDGVRVYRTGQDRYVSANAGGWTEGAFATEAAARSAAVSATATG